MSSQTHVIAQNNDFDLREILMSLWRNRVLVIVIAAITFALAFLVIVTRPTYYNATATILIEKGDLNLPDFVEVTGGDQFSNFTVQTEVKVLTSSDLALKTIEATKFGEKVGHPDA